MRVGGTGECAFCRTQSVLGLLIDEQLQSTEHVRVMLANVRKRVGGLNFLAGRKWGPSPSPRSLRACYWGYIESKIRG